jgi:anti-sigma factor RsiW
MKRDTAELLAAYVDGVGELSPSERKRVELYLAAEPGARDDEAATRELLGTLRELPPQGEPDWTALERSIHEAVGEAAPQPWWRRWRLALPAGFALAGAAAVLVLVLRGGAAPGERAEPVVQVPAPVEPMPAAPEHDTVAVYLDGDDLELAIETADLAEDTLDEITFAGLDDLEVADNLLGEDLGWVDELDDAALRRLEGLLERAKGT